MDILALNPKSGGLVWGPATKRLDKGLRQTGGWRVLGGEEEALGFGGGLQIRVSARRTGRASSLRHRSLVVRATGKNKNHDKPSSSGNNDPSIPEGDGSEGIHPFHDKSKSSESPHKSHHTLSDWRNFRAKLVRDEQVQLVDPDALTEGTASDMPSQRLGLKWAHPLSMPETGCMLVATEKLDGVSSFERTVVLLLRLGSRDPREGPFGVILNRPLNKKIKHMKPSNPDLASTFADCSLHFGGPLDASIFLLKASGNSSIPGFEQVVPDIYFGARNSLDEAAGLVKKGAVRPQDFRFFVGYAGWLFDQLQEEIELDYWVVASCSSQLINDALADSSSNLWEEILQLMGGQYSELSRKPKQDGS